MDDLIRALVILRGYGCPEYPTHCEHDALYVNVDASLVSAGDLAVLEELSFTPSQESGFVSFRFGSS